MSGLHVTQAHDDAGVMPFSYKIHVSEQFCKSAVGCGVRGAAISPHFQTVLRDAGALLIAGVLVGMMPTVLEYFIGGFSDPSLLFYGFGVVLGFSLFAVFVLRIHLGDDVAACRATGLCLAMVVLPFLIPAPQSGFTYAGLVVLMWMVAVFLSFLGGVWGYWRNRLSRDWWA